MLASSDYENFIKRRREMSRSDIGQVLGYVVPEYIPRTHSVSRKSMSIGPFNNLQQVHENIDQFDLDKTLRKNLKKERMEDIEQVIELDKQRLNYIQYELLQPHTEEEKNTLYDAYADTMDHLNYHSALLERVSRDKRKYISQRGSPVTRVKSFVKKTGKHYFSRKKSRTLSKKSRSLRKSRK
jgi:hypothetical protein